MTEKTNILQNRTVITCLIFAVLAVMVGYKTLHTAPFLDNQASTNLSLAEHFANANSSDKLHNRQSQRRHSAVYPLIIATLAEWSPKLKQNLACHKTGQTCDKTAFSSLIIIQYLLAVTSLIAIFVTARTLSQSWKVAIFTLAFAFIAGIYGGHAGQIRDVIWSQTFMLLFLMCVALGSVRDQRCWTFTAGVALGLTALFLPLAWLVGLVTAACFFYVARLTRPALHNPASHALMLLFGLGLVAALAAVSSHSDTLISSAIPQIQQGMAERGELSDINGWHQLSLLVSPLPIVGGILQKIFNLFPAQEIEGLIAQSRGPGSLWSQLIATPGILLRGLWVGTPILTLMGLAQIYPLIKFSREDLRLGPTLIVVIPILALVALNAALTINTPAYNVGFVFLLTYTTGYLIARADVRRQFWAKQDHGDSALSDN